MFRNKVPAGLSPGGHLGELMRRLPKGASFRPENFFERHSAGYVQTFIDGQLTVGRKTIPLKVSLINIQGGQAIVSAPNTKEGAAALRKIRGIYGKPAFTEICGAPGDEMEFRNHYYLNDNSSALKELLKEVVKSHPNHKRML